MIQQYYLITAGILHNAVTTGIVTSSLIVAADVTTNTLTYATLQQVSGPAILGRFSAGAGNIAELALDLADTTHYLRKDGTWQTVTASLPGLTTNCEPTAGGWVCVKF